MNKRFALIVFLLSAACTSLYAADSFTLYSPGKNVKVVVTSGRQLTYELYFENNLVLQPSVIDLQLENGQQLSADLRVKKSTVTTIDSIIFPQVADRRRQIRDYCNQLTIEFKKPFVLQLKAYDDGFAYRIGIRFGDSVIIKNEVADIRLQKEDKLLMPQMDFRSDADSFHTSFESLYTEKAMDSVSTKMLTYSPVVVTKNSGLKIAITESDLDDYPGMFLRGNENTGLQSAFAKFPLEQKLFPGDYPQWVVTKRADYIAKIAGNRMLPWRAFLLAKNDKELPANDLVYKLGAPTKIPDASWIHPGNCTDEWIIGLNLFDVPFKAGLNTASYLYYIDFAKRFGISRIMMDAGWSDTKDLFAINPNINIDSIVAYAKKQGVKLSMWTLAATLDKQLDSALERFNKWGLDFIMTDFMDRDDQQMVRFYKRIAEACARHKIMIMFHGAFPQKGFNRTWPNNITREGVLGSEYNIWSNKPSPEHDLTLPFTRMLAGPLDYEPGFLNNATQTQFRMVEKNPMSQGTRCHQLAMFVVYDNPLQIFSGNPSQGLREPEFMEVLAGIPTTWDETKIIDAKMGDYIVSARRLGDDWYIAGMTDWTPRTINFSFDFLPAGNYTATICRDGVNADSYAADYSMEKQKVKAGDSMQIGLAPGGGFLIRLKKD